MIIPKFITIHNTDNTKPGTDAKSHGRFLRNIGYYLLGGREHWVSWHYSVDDHRVVKHLPIHEKAFHAISGNSQSIGIEICMNQGIDQDKAFLNAARLCAILLFDLHSLDKDVNRVVSHKFWTGKNCPRLLLDKGNIIGYKWNGFLELIRHQLGEITDEGFPFPPNRDTVSGSIHDLTDHTIPESFTDFHLNENNTEDESITEISLERTLYSSLVTQAEKRGVAVETLVNLWLWQRLDDDKTEQ